MQVSRKILLPLVVVGLLVVGTAASIALLYPSLPDPRTADREGLFRWLVACDLRQESMDTRRTLARRFEEEFCTPENTTVGEEKEPPDWQCLKEQLDRSQRQQLWDNLPVMLEPWFLEKTRRYSELPQAERMAYLDRIIEMIEALGGIDALRPDAKPTADPPQENGLQALLLSEVERWKQKAEPSQKEEIDQFLTDMQTRWFLRTLGFESAS